MEERFTDNRTLRNDESKQKIKNKKCDEQEFIFVRQEILPG